MEEHASSETREMIIRKWEKGEKKGREERGRTRNSRSPQRGKKERRNRRERKKRGGKRRKTSHPRLVRRKPTLSAGQPT